jgi:hypothetical protein
VLFHDLACLAGRVKPGGMAPRESSKPSALSDEYVVDSSDDQAGPGLVRSQKAGATPRVKQRSSAKPKEPKGRKTTSPSTEPSSRSQSLEEDDQDEDEDDEDESQLADLLDESATQASRKPLSDKDRPKKKAKTMYVLCLISVQALLMFKELLLSVQYQQSSMSHLQALSAILQ